MITNSKSRVISFRVKEPAYEHIKQLASNQQMDITTYARSCLLEYVMNPEEVVRSGNTKSQFACDYDYEIMQLVLKSFIMISALAIKTLDEAKIRECNELITTQLNQWKHE